MSPTRYDIIVVGSGAIGLSAAYHCAMAGKKVLLIEQYDLFNDRASSKGLSRFFRIVYADPLLPFSHSRRFPPGRSSNACRVAS